MRLVINNNTDRETEIKKLSFDDCILIKQDTVRLRQELNERMQELALIAEKEGLEYEEYED